MARPVWLALALVAALLVGSAGGPPTDPGRTGAVGGRLAQGEATSQAEPAPPLRLAAFDATLNVTLEGPGIHNNWTAYTGWPVFGPPLEGRLANVTGGSGTDSYWWHGLPPPCATANTSYFPSCSPAYPGNFTVRLQVNDTAGATALSNPFWVDVVRNATFEVTFEVQPSSCGPVLAWWNPPAPVIRYANASYPNGSVGTYSMEVGPLGVGAGVAGCTGYTFEGWDYVGGVAPGNGPRFFSLNPYPEYHVNLTVSGNGTLTAVFVQNATGPHIIGHPLFWLAGWLMVALPIAAAVIVVLLFLWVVRRRRRREERLAAPREEDPVG